MSHRCPVGLQEWAAPRRCALLPALLVGTLPLGGCVPIMAAQAVSMVANSAASGPRQPSSPASARSECSAHAAQFGAVHVIDVEQRPSGNIIVWGTVDDGRRKQSFQCNYALRITSFKLRPLAAQPAS